ncbi:peptide/nickel transport system substrate-binding protein [Tindallia magadiensis]|uniref:Peptide/nickel transport system substrate-binding protein n=1 Tax=Tindallia magadiensis TaxID=69895 RepID=A0A1I3GR58_9FIRM|nr:ABC transporter substrate-binding protein [Tindallia magadiensis]SFI25831.1 peptide/nickel transport system substrate-binding protein [Tindallia magadiensis]
MTKKVLLLIVMVLLFAAGCADNSEEVGNSGQEGSDLIEKNNDSADQSTHHVNIGLFWLDADIEPTTAWHGWTLARLGVGENLIQLDENMNFVGKLAESWEVIDETTAIFELRENAYFHNGKKVDAEAVKASIQRALELTDRDDVKFPLESIEAEGNTVKIRTEEPWPTLLNLLADPVYIIVDAEAAESAGFNMAPVATGPFRVTSFIAEEGLSLTRHEEHWSGKSNIESIDAKYIPDASVRAMALQTGEIDFATQLNHTDLEIFEDTDEYVVLRGPNLRIFQLRLNMDKPYMKYPEFRQALVHGIDKNSYAKELANGVPAKGPFAPQLSFSFDGEVPYNFDPEKAKDLLDDLGIVDVNGDGFREYQGERIILSYVARSDLGQVPNTIGSAMQAQYRDIGLDMELVLVESDSSLVESGDFDMRWERWTSAPTGDPQSYLQASFGSDGSGNRGNYSNEELDSLIQKLVRTVEKEDRDRIGIQAAELLITDVPALFLYYGEGNVVHSSRLTGIERFTSEVYYIDERMELQ